MAKTHPGVFQASSHISALLIIIIIKEWVKDNVGKNSCLKGQGPPTPPNIHIEEIKIVNKKVEKKDKNK